MASNALAASIVGGDEPRSANSAQIEVFVLHDVAKENCSPLHLSKRIVEWQLGACAEFGDETEVHCFA
jgi:hypothetical protein